MIIHNKRTHPSNYLKRFALISAFSMLGFLCLSLFPACGGSGVFGGFGKRIDSVRVEEVGVLVNTQLDTVYVDSIFYEGVYELGSSEELKLFDVRERIFRMQDFFRASDQTKFEAHLTIWHHLIPEKVGYLLEKGRENQVERILEMEADRVFKKIFTEFHPFELWSRKREYIEDNLLSQLKTAPFVSEYLQINVVRLNNIELPESVNEYIAEDYKIAEKMAVEEQVWVPFIDLYSQDAEARRKTLEKLIERNNKRAYLLIERYLEREKDSVRREEVRKQIRKARRK